MHFDPDHSYNNDSDHPYDGRPPFQLMEPGQGMLTLSIVLGGIALATTCCIYSSLILGALSIILAMLSRGQKKKLSPEAKVAVATAGAAMLLSVCITAGTFAYSVHQYGSVENFLKQYSSMVESMTGQPVSDAYGF